MHWMVTSEPQPAALAPLALPAAALAWAAFRRGPRSGALALVLIAALFASALQWPRLAHTVPLLAQLAVCLGLMWLFGRTLLPGHEPLVTRMSRMVHGPLPAAIVRYTRNVTRVWALFMGAMAAASLLLFLLAPSAVWSAFANLLFLPLIALLFLAEYGYRLLRYSWFTRASIAQSIDAFRRFGLSGPPGSRPR
jgi:uncharacterized membrane protein